MSTTYTCNTCVQQFPNSETQREHMKTDWHRYNLKRKVAGLLPIAANVFASKVLQQSEAVPERRQKQITKKEMKYQERMARRVVRPSSPPSPRRLSFLWATARALILPLRAMPSTRLPQTETSLRMCLLPYLKTSTQSSSTLISMKRPCRASSISTQIPSTSWHCDEPSPTRTVWCAACITTPWKPTLST